MRQGDPERAAISVLPAPRHLCDNHAGSFEIDPAKRLLINESEDVALVIGIEEIMKLKIPVS